jgi:Fe-S-cluster containining protein
MSGKVLDQLAAPGDAARGSSGLQSEVIERLAAAPANAQANLARAGAAPDYLSLMRRAQVAGTVAKRVYWLRQAGTAFGQAMQPAAACKPGCAHCCHIPVNITDVEAREIGRKIGRTPAGGVGIRTVLELYKLQVDDAQSPLPGAPSMDRPYSSPCPFLDGTTCSIYDVRPLACRVHFNLDDDELLCALVANESIPVPLANAMTIKAMYLMAQPSARLADIRWFFPKQIPGGSAVEESPSARTAVKA